MEKLIDNLDDEDFENVKLYTYTFLFKDMNEDQKQYAIDQFHDWDWGQGLYIAELIFEKKENYSKFTFKSPKKFEDKDSNDWNDNDLQNNLLTKLIGKEQFISTFSFSDCNLHDLEISFFDNDATEYNVEVSKFSSIMKK